MQNHTATETETSGDVIASGTTYGLREQFKMSGAQYDGATRMWRLTPAQHVRFCELVGPIASPNGNKKAREFQKAWDGIVFTTVQS